LSNNLSVRGAEELTRKTKAKANIAPKQQKPAQRLESEELDQFGEDIASKLTTDQVKVKVKISQSRIEGKIHIVAKGKQEATAQLVKLVRDAVVNA